MSQRRRAAALAAMAVMLMAGARARAQEALPPDDPGDDVVSVADQGPFAIDPSPGYVASGPVGSFSVGSNFTGSTINTSGYIPPDTMGAIGPNSFVELVNGNYAVYDRAGGLQTRTSLDAFWASAGVTLNRDSFDPRIVYDASSGHFYASALDRGFRDAATGKDYNNDYLVAVSNDSNPLHGWHAFKFTATDGRFHDYDTLGYNADGVYITTNNFASGVAGTPATNSIGVLALPKADLIAGSVANATLSLGIDPNSTGYAPQPVINLNNTGGPELLLSDYNTPAGFQKISSIDSISPQTLNTIDRFVTSTSYGGPPGAQQLGSTHSLDAGDTRFGTNVIQQGNSLWAVQGVSANGRASLRWEQIDPTTHAIVREGLITDPNFDYYYGSIAVDAAGNIVIGYSGSNGSTYVGTYASVGFFDGTSVTLGSPTLLKAGVGPYYVTYGGDRNRWGDYSATMLDPSQPGHFWTIQEWASGTNAWSTQITEIILTPVPEPGALALTALGLAGLAGAGWRRRHPRRPA